MNRRTGKRTGFAMLLVMLLLSMSVVLGMSYLSSASVKLASSGNLLYAGRAKYLAESGLQHALYLLKYNPSALDGTSSASPLGPFYADATSDTYRLYAVPQAGTPGKYTVFAEATAGGIKQRSAVTVYCSTNKPIQSRFGMQVGTTWAVRLPSTLTVTGDLHTNGNLRNRATINGNVTAAKQIWNTAGVITGTSTEHAEAQEPPAIQWDDYKSYKVFGATYGATEEGGGVLHGTNPLCDGGAISPTNPAGVVWLRPRWTDTVKLTGDLNFKGTLVIDGNLELDGANITLTPQDGFPAVVVTGQILITNRTNGTINGLVVADDGVGISPWSWTTAASRLTINGGLVSKNTGFDRNLEGRYVLNFDADKSKLYDVTRSNPEQSDLTVVSWND